MSFRMQEDRGTSLYSAADLVRAISQPNAPVLLDSLPDAVLCVDPAGVARLVNRAAQTLLDPPIDTAVFSLRTYLERLGIDAGAVVKAVSLGTRLNRVETLADGRSILISCRPALGTDGKLAFSVLVLRNLDLINRQIESAARSGFVSVGESAAAVDRGIVLNPSSAALIEQAMRAVHLGIRVLIVGESGAGKTEIARQVHAMTLGSNRPFIHVNCAGIPESLFESEMFGYAAGSFTGALNRGKKGLIEAADKGTLFLDEVGEIPLHCQAKLLKFLEDGVVQRVGATGGRRVAIQLFSATNRDLLDMSRSGAFRKDLYYRLSSLTLTVPALRETRDLIPDLVRIFVARLNARRDRPFSLDAACMRRLIEYDYPGNIREMQNIIEHLAVMCDGLAGEEHLPASVLSATSKAIAAPQRGGVNGTPLPFSCLPESMPSPVLGIPTIADPTSFLAVPSSGGFPVASLKDEVRRYEKYLVREAVRRAGSKRKAAELLSVDIATVVRKTREADEVEDG